MSAKEGEFYSLKEVASSLGISRKRVLELIYSGKIQANRKNNRWEVPRAEMLRLLKSPEIFKKKNKLNHESGPLFNEQARGREKIVEKKSWYVITKEELEKEFNEKSFTCVDLFCGAGGLSLGFKWAGFKVMAAVDNYREAIETFKYNFPSVKVFEGDIRDKTLKKNLVSYVKNELKDRQLDVIVGGPPCQGFSLAGLRLIEDPRNNLYKDFLEIVQLLKPKVVVMENVEGLRSFLNGLVEKKILEELRNLGYESGVEVLDAAWYGVPQRRRRTIIIANRLGIDNLFPDKVYSEDEYRTIKDAIEDLMERDEDPKINHIFTRHSEKIKKALEKLPQGRALYSNYSDSWKRPYWNKPAPTVKENHGGVHVHPILPRVMTPRELARLQSFPDSFIFKGAKKHQLIQIGNAVPPLMAKAIALVVRRMLCQE